MRLCVRHGGIDVDSSISHGTTPRQSRIHPHSQREGFLLKRSRIGNTWNKRYVVVVNSMLIYYKKIAVS